MSEYGSYPLLKVDLGDDYVATVELCNGKYNHFNMEMLAGLADAFEALDEESACRVILLCAGGSAFCAGADFQGGSNGAVAKGLQGSGQDSVSGHLYDEAVRLFASRKPIVAAVHGSAVGGGLGLALVADFRVGCPDARFAANFTQLGFHPGFGLTYTLPQLIGQQNACDMFYSGRRVKAEEALQMGLIDQLVQTASVRDSARERALQIASAAPLAVVSVRETLRGDLADHVRAATQRELQEQNWLMRTEDAAEGIRAVSERRAGNFHGK